VEKNAMPKELPKEDVRGEGALQTKKDKKPAILIMADCSPRRTRNRACFFMFLREFCGMFSR